MKKLITFLALVVILTTTSFAQRLNSKGQQMVSSIKVYGRDTKLKYTFNFTYDNQNRLVRLTNKGISSDYEIWYADGNLHKKKEGNPKNGEWCKYTKYTYTLDSNRNILKKVFKCYDIYMVGYERWDYNFTYGYPASDTIYQVVKSEQNYIPAEVKNNKAIPHYEYIEKTYYTFKFECGNEHIINSGQRSADGRTYSLNSEEGFKNYSSYRNMTNLNLNYVLNIGYISGEYAECATEWCNHFSYCLPEELTGSYYVYHFRDKPPYSLYMAELFHSSGVLDKTFVFKYVDEE